MYIYHYMSIRNYITPSIYQGMYNAITRQVEDELFPILSKCWPFGAVYQNVIWCLFCFVWLVIDFY